MRSLSGKILILLLSIIISCSPHKTTRRGQESCGSTGPENSETPSSPPAIGEGSATSAKPSDGTKPAVAMEKPILEEGSLNVQWIHGSANCGQDINPPLQVHVYNKNLSLLRQNKCLNFEAPFIYLIFGEKKALLIDSGATASAATFPLRKTVETLLTDHYGAAQRAQVTLVVAHSHGHGDHRSADPQFAGQAGTTFVGAAQPAVAAFFGVTAWPETIVDYDLGSRILKVIPIPGHEASHIAFYDAKTGILFTGDTLHPGRLYIHATEETEITRLTLTWIKNQVVI